MNQQIEDWVDFHINDMGLPNKRIEDLVRSAAHVRVSNNLNELWREKQNNTNLKIKLTNAGQEEDQFLRNLHATNYKKLEEVIKRGVKCAFYEIMAAYDLGFEEGEDKSRKDLYKKLIGLAAAALVSLIMVLGFVDEESFNKVMMIIGKLIDLAEGWVKLK